MQSATKNPPVGVMVVDDHPLLREGIIAVLSNDMRFAVVAQAGDGSEAVRQFLRHRPDVTLMDMHMPVMDGPESVAAILKICPGAKIIVLATCYGDVPSLRAIQAGANGYLLKSALRAELPKAVIAVHNGNRYIPAQVTADLAEYIETEALSAREAEVLFIVAAGNSNKHVAKILGISEDTVKVHMRAILAKLGASDRTHAVAIAFRRGILSSKT
jgi:DNA-binding NarL/FixJ family response regulator